MFESCPIEAALKITALGKFFWGGEGGICTCPLGHVVDYCYPLIFGWWILPPLTIFPKDSCVVSEVQVSHVPCYPCAPLAIPYSITWTEAEERGGH